jgi:hypothetical protein
MCRVHIEALRACEHTERELAALMRSTGRLERTLTHMAGVHHDEHSKLTSLQVRTVM